MINESQKEMLNKLFSECKSVYDDNDDPLVICGTHVRCDRVGDMWICPVCKKSWNDKELKRC